MNQIMALPHTIALILLNNYPPKVSWALGYISIFSIQIRLANALHFTIPIKHHNADGSIIILNSLRLVS